MMDFLFLLKFVSPWRSLELGQHPFTCSFSQLAIPAFLLPTCSANMLAFPPINTEVVYFLNVANSWQQSLFICEKYFSLNKYLLNEVGTILGLGGKAVNAIKFLSCIIGKFRHYKFPNQPRQMPLNATFFVVFFLLNEKLF